jgi:predicted nucleic acid-binding protein
MKIVLDTNVVVSGFVSPASFMEHWRRMSNG